MPDPIEPERLFRRRRGAGVPLGGDGVVVGAGILLGDVGSCNEGMVTGAEGGPATTIGEIGETEVGRTVTRDGAAATTTG